MTYQEEMYTHLVHGGDPQVLIDIFMEELEEAKKQAEKQLAREKEAEAAAKQFEEKRKVAREKAVAALKEYFALECPETTKEEELDMYVKVTIDTLRETIHQLGNIKVSRDGNHWEINFGNLFDALVR